MKLNSRSRVRVVMMIALMVVIIIGSSRLRADTGTCGGVTTTVPFTDVMASPFFCQIAEAFFSGLTNGTSATTYSPAQSVPREQMAAFVTRTMDQSLRRGSRRAAHKRFWTPTSENGLGLTAVGFVDISGPVAVESDGADLWVANSNVGNVQRVRASDGKLLDSWTGPVHPSGVLAAKGLIFVIASDQAPGKLFQIDPTQPPAAVTTLPVSFGDNPSGISFDGGRIWTANRGGSVSIITFNPLSPTTVTAGFTSPEGILYDGANIWVTDVQGVQPVGKLFKLDSNGAIIQTVNVGTFPGLPVFDGTNIWVPNVNSNSVTVVRASTGVVLATLTGNGLSGPRVAAFDGERILFTNTTGNSVSLWKAADLNPLGSVSTGTDTLPFGTCSDGLNFWITLSGAGKLARF